MSAHKDDLDWPRVRNLPMPITWRPEIRSVDNNERGDAQNNLHYHFKIYGKRVCSDVNLPGLVRSKFDVCDIRYSWTRGSVPEAQISDISDVSKRFTTNVGSDLIVTESSSGYSLLWEEKCQFFLSAEGSKIQCVSEPGVEFGWIVSLLYAMVFSFALHLQDLANVHAGCVVTADGAVGLMAAPGTGKSTLTAVLAAAGMPFLTDDILAVTKSESGYLAHPGYPTVSLTRESAAVVLDSPRMDQYEAQFRFEKARIEIDSKWATFEHDSSPLTALILLERDAKSEGSEPTRLSRIDATRAIVENTVGLPYLPKTALQNHLEFAGAVGAVVPVWKLPLPGNLIDMAASTPDVVNEIAAQSAS